MCVIVDKQTQKKKVTRIDELNRIVPAQLVPLTGVGINAYITQLMNEMNYQWKDNQKNLNSKSYNASENAAASG